MQGNEPPDSNSGQAAGITAPPEQVKIPASWPHLNLYNRVREALLALPSLFKPDLSISGVLATDLHTFNTSLGSTIEAQVTAALNASRMIWDPNKRYASYRFVRQSQTFPDVILKAADPEAPVSIIMGIELKGWFALSKEGEPSFR